MTGVADPKPVLSRARRRWAVLAAAVVVAAAGLGLWRAARRPLSDGERAMVGTWRVRVDGAASDLPLVYEFRPDRTCSIWATDPTAVTTPDATWRRTGDTLVVSIPGALAGPFWDVLGRGRPLDEVYALAPDGPDRVPYTGKVPGVFVRSPPRGGSGAGADGNAEPGAAADPGRRAGPGR